MPRLACRSCGRQIYTTVPLESLFFDERRCPRCGSFLDGERRADDRRLNIRRENPIDDPGPPKAAERREGDRRKGRRRKNPDGTTRTLMPDEPGWTD